MSSILFINASPNKDGNTVRLAKALLAGKDYKELDLADYRINDYGQTLPGDQFDEVFSRIEAADTVVIGSPVYWHNLNGSIRTVLDRFYGPVEPGSLAGRRLFFLFQGGAPTPEMLAWGEYTVRRFASLYGMEYEGMATDVDEARKLAAKL